MHAMELILKRRTKSLFSLLIKILYKARCSIFFIKFVQFDLREMQQHELSWVYQFFVLINWLPDKLHTRDLARK